jgi:hypothetical protein
MKKKAFIFLSLTLLLALSFIYIQSSDLIAGDDPVGKKDCSSECTKSQNSSSGTESTMDDGLSVYEFTTDKVSCEGSKSDLKSSLLKVSGVKGVEFGETCNVSHKTSVKLLYSAGETSEDNIKTSVSDYDSECTGKTEGSCNKKSTDKKDI